MPTGPRLEALLARDARRPALQAAHTHGRQVMGLILVLDLTKEDVVSKYLRDMVDKALRLLTCSFYLYKIYCSFCMINIKELFEMR